MRQVPGRGDGDIDARGSDSAMPKALVIVRSRLRDGPPEPSAYIGLRNLRRVIAAQSPFPPNIGKDSSHGPQASQQALLISKVEPSAQSTNVSCW